jgi:hypothetical protein
MRDVIRSVAILSLLTIFAGGLWWTNGWLYRTSCQREIAFGYVAYECRHYWDLCEMYYSDCRNVSDAIRNNCEDITGVACR